MRERIFHGILQRSLLGSRITVLPWKSLNLQMHHHQNEYWIVVKSTARMTIGDKVTYVHENGSIYVPKTVPHGLENPGKIPF